MHKKNENNKNSNDNLHYFDRELSRTLNWPDGAFFVATLSNWHWDVLDLLVLLNWSDEQQLIDYAHKLFLAQVTEKKVHNPTMPISFEDILKTVITRSYEAWCVDENGYANQNRKTPPEAEEFPFYLCKQTSWPFGI